MSRIISLLAISTYVLAIHQVDAFVVTQQPSFSVTTSTSLYSTPPRQPRRMMKKVCDPLLYIKQQASCLIETIVSLYVFMHFVITHIVAKTTRTKRKEYRGRKLCLGDCRNPTFGKVRSKRGRARLLD